tara:strand:- start:1431 stop:2585 length:1155 start_codon:yes stop_codon:yes gene_type:complete
MVQKTTAINKILSLGKRIKAVQGGTSAGKTYGILPILINTAINTPMIEISVVAESVPHLKRGALKDFKKMMHSKNNWRARWWNATDKKFNFPNGSYIEFFSADDDAKLRGARRDVLYMNECNNMSLHVYTELSARTKGDIYLDWNPTSEFWFHDQLQGDEDVDFLILTYKDNEACPQSAIDFILKAKDKSKTSKYWANWYKVYGLGQIGSLQGSVFENWRLGDFNPDHIPTIYGQDYGYSNDPTTLIEVAIDKKKKLIYAKELLYKTKLTTSEIANINIRHAGDSLIVGDSAEPRLIQEVRSKGCNLVATKKGKDSILTGIKIMQDYDIVVDHKSSNMVKELNNYRWLDKGNKPCDDHNHLIDALRYAVFYQLSNPNKGMYYIS